MAKYTKKPLKTVPGFVLCTFLILIFFYWERGTAISIILPWPMIAAALGLPFLFSRSYKIDVFSITIFALIAFHCLNLAAFYIFNFEEPYQTKFIIFRSAFTFLIILIGFQLIKKVELQETANVAKIATIVILFSASLLIVLAYASDVSIRTMVENFYALNLRPIDKSWRLVFTNFSEAIDPSESGNFRNAIAALMFTFICMALPAWRKPLGQIAILVGAGLTILFLSGSGFVLLFLLIATTAFAYRPFIFVFLAVFGVILIFGAGFLSADLFNAEYINARIEGSTEGRLGHIQEGWHDIQRSHYLGEYVGYKIHTVEGYLLYPHNMFIAIWLNGGLLGFLIFLGLYLTILLSVAFTIIRLARQKKVDVLLLSGAIATFPFLLRSQVGSPVSYFADYGSAIGIAYFLATKSLTKFQTKRRNGNANSIETG